MTDFRLPRLLTVSLSAGMALSLAGCMGATYGTGTPTGMQTLEDIAGIASLGGAKKEKIDYSPRPKIIAPPETAQLPPPEDPEKAAQLASNWPQDPDVTAAKIKAAGEASGDTGIYGPGFRLPKGAVAESREPIRPSVHEHDFRDEAMRSPNDPQSIRKNMAAAKGIVAVDASGNPVRRYLTDPPNDYRIPDPTEPVAIPDKKPAKKKFKWWWQQ
jgi:hypothetical protein